MRESYPLLGSNFDCQPFHVIMSLMTKQLWVTKAAKLCEFAFVAILHKSAGFQALVMCSNGGVPLCLLLKCISFSQNLLFTFSPSYYNRILLYYFLIMCTIRLYHLTISLQVSKHDVTKAMTLKKKKCSIERFFETVKIKKFAPEYWCLIELSAMTEMSRICTVQSRSTSHLWLLSTWNMASVTEELNCLIGIFISKETQPQHPLKDPGKDKWGHNKGK